MIKDLVAELYPLHKTLSSDGMNEALRIIQIKWPGLKNKSSMLHTEEYPVGQKVWTWIVPEHYKVNLAYISNDQGKVIDFDDNPLHLVSYSLPINKIMTWDELAPHLHYNAKRPDVIPWKFKYYERDWGFCLPYSQYLSLPADAKYHVVIDAEFTNEPLKIGTGLIGDEHNTLGELVIMAHLCHPNQANDDASGVAVAVELARRLVDKPLPDNSMSIRFWFGPETIGSIAWLANNEDLIPFFNGGIFLEMLGNDNRLALQHSLQGSTILDKISAYVCGKHSRTFQEVAFTELAANDERTLNGPGVNVPCVSITRAPYPEYHTSDDNMDIIHERKLEHAANTVEEIIRIYASNYYPKLKNKGPIFLSRYGLFVKPDENWLLNRALEKVMMSLDGTKSIFEIATDLELDYWETRDWIEKLYAKDLIYVRHLKC